MPRVCSKIFSNEQVSGDFYLMKAECPNDARMGQFYMIRAWETYPVLSRPVSVFDTDGKTVSFLYKVVGKGTEIFAGLKAGGEITLEGPLGNTFPDLSGKIAMVGGGVGIAPFYLTARELKARHPESRIDLYLGFSDQALLVDDYRKAADNVIVDVGGFITDSIDPALYEHIFTCGPEIMMRVLYEKCRRAGAGDRLYVSMENRMACGVGACFVCSCKTSKGNKKVCKDGPVFPGKEVFGL
ncbi:MAG: dihydroorotate dehydrogenase electron transfer subunit [Synergistaceae bacterium]|jgi:dihydroorotate dehydrogenase electron transfer subunit|nr:dihydroorotate dehydrogenase electron transfer subunit [Synergistaceae bacterium]